MKIVLNAASAKMGGAVSYLTNLLKNLPPHESEYQFFVFLPSDTARELVSLPANIKLCRVPDKSIGGWRRVWWEQITLRRFLRRTKVDLLFSTANFAMFRCPVKQILLVRNALYFSELYRQTFLPKHSLKMRIAFRLRRWMICQSAKSVDFVMTPTQAMLDELRQYVEVPHSKALVNPYGVEPTYSQGFKHATRARGHGNASVAQRSISLLYVSLYSEHKNLATLLKAMPLLNKDGNRRFLLRTTADPGWEGSRWTVTYHDDLALSCQPDVAPWVEFLGPLGRENVQQLYREGDLFVFPSLCESFGHPLIEAMAHGLPVVASDTPVNREICGGAALYFKPLYPVDLAAQVHRVASDVYLRQRLLTEANRRLCAQFTWAAHIRKILGLFQSLPWNSC